MTNTNGQAEEVREKLAHKTKEKIARLIFDKGNLEGWFITGSTVYNFCDDAEPEKDGSRDVATEIFEKVIQPLVAAEKEAARREEREKLPKVRQKSLREFAKILQDFYQTVDGRIEISASEWEEVCSGMDSLSDKEQV